MTNWIFLILLLLVVLAPVIILVIYKVRQLDRGNQHPQPVRIVFKDPHGLATEFQYTLNPNRPRRMSFGNMVFVTEAGLETPPAKRVFEIEGGKQGDILSVTWILRNGKNVVGTTPVPTSSQSPLTVILTQTQTVQFEMA